MSRKDARRRKSRNRSIERLEDRRVMSADPLGSLPAGIDDGAPALVHHAERDADFWIDPIAERDLDTLLGDVEQTLASAHGLTGLTQVRNNYGFVGTGQTVAIIDSGIAYDHYALGGGYGPNYRVVGGWDFTEENDWNQYDDGPAGSHGTHVAGIVGADLAGTSDDGVAPGVDLVALRVFNDAGDGYFNWVESALRWVHTYRNSYENPITTVNLSLGTSWNSTSIPSWSTLEDEFAQLEADGIFVSVSAGNSFTTYNTPGLSYPAASPYVVPVMSVDDGGGLSYFSQRHTRAIAAPGRMIVSTVPDYAGNNNGVTDDFASFSGTSMAAPYVAGASVLLRQAMQFVGYTGITQDTIFDHMMATADTFFDAATNTNYKRLNLASAFNALMPADEYGSSAVAAHNLGTISGQSTIYGLIGTLSDADYFTFTAAATGAVSFTVSTSPGLAPVWTAAGGSGSVSGANGQTYTFDVMAGQTYSLGLSTSNGIGWYTLNINATIPNSRPVLQPIGNRSVSQGSLLSFTATADDPDAGQHLTYGLHGGPAGASVHHATGAFSWTPNANQVPGTYTMTIWVMDDQTPYMDDWETFQITVTPFVNSRPVLQPIGNRSVSQGSLLSFTATAVDPDAGQRLTYGLHGGPAGASVQHTTGAFSWTPNANQVPGTYTMTIWVMDDQTPYMDDWETFQITVTPPPPSELRYLSTSTSGWLPSTDNSWLYVTNADIARLAINANGHRYSMHFNGGDVGLTATTEGIDAFTFLPDGSILISTGGAYSVSTTYNVAGYGSGATIGGGGEDVLRFTPTTLGDYTTGTWSLYFDGSDVGLSTRDENIDALSVLSDGRLIISTVGRASVPGVVAEDEDLLAFTPWSLGANTWGAWGLYFDGSDVGLTTSYEDIDAVFVGEWSANPELFISTRGNYSVAGNSGANEDLFAFRPWQLGGATGGNFVPQKVLDGSNYGLAAFDVDGFYFGQAPGAGSFGGAKTQAADVSLASAESILADAAIDFQRAGAIGSKSSLPRQSPLQANRATVIESRFADSEATALRDEMLVAWCDSYTQTSRWRYSDNEHGLLSWLSQDPHFQETKANALIDRVFLDLGSQI